MSRLERSYGTNYYDTGVHGAIIYGTGLHRRLWRAIVLSVVSVNSIPLIPDRGATYSLE